MLVAVRVCALATAFGLVDSATDSERRQYAVVKTVSDWRTRFLPDYIVPGIKQGRVADTIRGLALPGRRHDTVGSLQRVPFRPFQHELATSFLYDDGNGFGYGLGVQGVNPLRLDVAGNYPFYSNLAPIATDGNWMPFTLGLATGMQHAFDDKSQAWSGDLDIPILGLGRVFDLDANLRDGPGLSGLLDFPLLYNNERFPLSAKRNSISADPQVHFGQVIPNVNLHNVPTGFLLDRLARGRPANPAFLGK